MASSLDNLLDNLPTEHDTVITHDHVTLHTFMDFLIQSYGNFSGMNQVCGMNLKCMMPSKRVVSEQVLIGKEFNAN